MSDLKPIRLKSNLVPEFPLDVERLVAIAKARGYDLNAAEAEAAWKTRSEEWSAGWLELGLDDQAIWEALLKYALEVDAPPAEPRAAILCTLEHHLYGRDCPTKGCGWRYGVEWHEEKSVGEG